MLLAAGRGTRMAPLTPRWTKASLPVLDEPLLKRLVAGLAAQGVEGIVVNAHGNADPLRRALVDATIPLEFSCEPSLRGSGGGILQARSFLEGSSPFLVLNADMCIELDVAELLRAHARGGTLVTLALREDPRKHEFGTIGYAEDHTVCRITHQPGRGTEIGSGLFTGVHVMQPEIFAQLPDRAEFNIVRDVYMPWLESGPAIGAWLQPSGAHWWPVGSPGELLDANLKMLERTLRLRSSAADEVLIGEGAKIEGELRGPAWIGPAAHVAAGARVGPWAVIGAHARVPRSARVQESLLLPETRLRHLELPRRSVAFGEEIWVDG